VSLFDKNIKFYRTFKKNFILGLDLDPESDPGPNPHSSKSLDPAPHIMNADQKHLKIWQKLKYTKPV
jgi:hypothetical protein